MRLEFDDIRGKESGKVGLVCGTGGSLKEYHKEFERLSKTEKDKYCCISCNEWNQKTHLDVDYWVVANSVFTVGEQYSNFNNQNAILVYADSVDTTDRGFVDSNLTIDYLPYDERHFGGKPCARPISCCPLLIPDRKTIQEYLQHISGHELRYDSCGTVGIHMLALAVMLGCNPIYVSGIDMNYNTGYVDNSSAISYHDNIADYSSSFDIQVKIISDSAKKLGIEIINLNKDSGYEGLKKGDFIKI